MWRSILILCFISPCIGSSILTQLYVVPSSSIVNDIRDGSLLNPYISLQEALDHIDYVYHRRVNTSRQITIYLYPTYHFVHTLRLDKAHSQIRVTTMNASDTAFYEKLAIHDYMHPRLSTASISGGMLITNWTKVSNNTYKAIVPSTIFVNQLFVNDRRIVRARVPKNLSEYLQFDAPLKDPNKARYGFQYAPGQFDGVSSDDAMVVVYHSWTTSHHFIDRLIPSNRTILFTNPSEYPMGAYAIPGKHRFHIENVCEALAPNTFCFNNQTKTVYLMTDGSYDPNKAQIITSINEYVLVLAGSDSMHPIEDIIVDNVAIQHSAWNIDRTQQADSQASAFLKSATLFIANATSIVVSNVLISHTGSYAVWIKEGTTNINMINSLVTDTGAGGIRIGQLMSPAPTPTVDIKIISNEVSYGGNVFPGGVAIITHHAIDVAIVDNSVHHHRYTGISVGWKWGYAPSYTSNILVKSNYIYSIGQHILCDQGGIYTLGVQPGTLITGNVIKNVFSYALNMWGIYLDEGTSEIVVSNNVVYNTGWASLYQHYGANNTIINNVFARASLYPPPQQGDPIPDGNIHIGLAENHTSLIFTRNIVYDLFQGMNHSAYKCNPMVRASFNNNIYYNTYGTPLLFGSEQVSFVEWQKTGQDNGSMISDPLFAGDVDQCDFFTVQPNSPAAKLGFTNIAKLSKWTPGCETDDDDIDTKQFYHW